MSPTARTSERSGKVLYKGTSNVREISKADFKQVGIDHDTLRWHAGNLFMVPMSDITLSEEEFKRCIEADSDFAIVDQDKDELPRNHPHNNRFNQADTPALGSDSVANSPTTTVGGSTAGATSSGGGTASGTVTTS